MTKRNLRYSGLGLAVLTAGALVACGSDDSPPPSGGAGTPAAGAPAAGSGGAAAGASNTAGSGGASAGSAGKGGAGGGAGYACVGTLPTAALITDFSNLVASTATPGQFTFTGGVLGGTYAYQPNALTLDTVGNTVLNVKGNVHAYDGFGLYFNTCYNAGAYTGVSFSVKGNAGPKGTLNFRVQTNSNTAVMANGMKGTCVPTNPADTYPDCHASAFDIPVTATPTVVTVLWSQLSGGVPVSAVSGSEIVSLEWAFDWTPGAAAGGGGAGGASGGSGGASGGAGGSGGKAGSGGSGGASGGSGGASGGSGGASAGAGGAPPAGAYDADITIDNVMFVGGPPAGGAGGASGAGGGSAAGAGGASAGSGGASAGSGGASAGSSGKAGSGGA